MNTQLNPANTAPPTSPINPNFNRVTADVTPVIVLIRPTNLVVKLETKPITEDQFIANIATPNPTNAGVRSSITFSNPVAPSVKLVKTEIPPLTISDVIIVEYNSCKAVCSVFNLPSND